MLNVFTRMLKADTFISLNKFRLQLTPGERVVTTEPNIKMRSVRKCD